MLFLFAASFLPAQQPLEIPFDSVPDFLKLPSDLYFGEVAGVALNSKGHVFVFSRGNSTGPAYAAAAAQLLEFESNGKFLREIGHNVYAWSYAHAVKVDKNDNIWVADKGSDLVIKFTPEGRLAMVFGRKQEASDEDTGPLRHPNPPLLAVDGMFRQVTDMAWDSAGNTYISDGYINSRVAKVDQNGEWIKSWGEPGSGPAVEGRGESGEPLARGGGRVRGCHGWLRPGRSAGLVAAIVPVRPAPVYSMSVGRCGAIWRRRSRPARDDRTTRGWSAHLGVSKNPRV